MRKIIQLVTQNLKLFRIYNTTKPNKTETSPKRKN